MLNDLECPYCGKGLDVCHDDGQGYEEDVSHQMKCEHCGKNFVFQTSTCFYYEPEKADCLNDSKHIWKDSRTFPKQFTKKVCEICGSKRHPTDAEMKTILAES